MPINNFPFQCGAPGHPAKPWIPVRIINPDTGQSRKLFGLIDTGADSCAIPVEYAQSLGHDLQAGALKCVITGNGPCVAFSHKTTLEFLDYSDNTLVAVPDVQVDYMLNLQVVLIGVEEFLRQYKLHIDYPAQTFSIKA